MCEENRTLNKNCIKNFILRIDIIKQDNFCITKIAEKMSAYFDRTEKRQINNFTVNFTNGNSEVQGHNFFDYVLVSEKTNTSMTFSESQSAFWLECNHYVDNSIYKTLIENLVKILQGSALDIQSKRIGLRYINEFQCNNIREIGKIYNKRLSTILKQMYCENTQSRIIGLEEYNNDGYKLRLQYGIPNKFYPSIIKVFNLLMDIDSYIESTNSIDEWNDIIEELNHVAYGLFIKEMNESYLEAIK